MEEERVKLQSIDLKLRDSKHIIQTMTCQGTKETFKGKASRSLLDLLTGSKIRDEGQVRDKT